MYYENVPTSIIFSKLEKKMIFSEKFENHKEIKLIEKIASCFKFTYCVQISERLVEKLKKM